MLIDINSPILKKELPKQNPSTYTLHFKNSATIKRPRKVEHER